VTKIFRFLLTALCLLGCSSSAEYDQMMKTSGFWALDRKVRAKCPKWGTTTHAQLFASCVPGGGSYPCKENRASFLTSGFGQWDIDRAVMLDRTLQSLTCKANAGDQYAFVYLKVAQQFPLEVPVRGCFYVYRDVILKSPISKDCKVIPSLARQLDDATPSVYDVLRRDPQSLLPKETILTEAQIPQGCLKRNVPYLNYNPCGISEIWLLDYALEPEKASPRATQARLMFEATSGESLEVVIARLEKSKKNHN
jgi:hypothetical protein